MANKNNGEYGDVLSCSFCGKSEYEVPRLFSGMNCYICIDCIRTAYGIIAEEEKVSRKRKMKRRAFFHGFFKLLEMLDHADVIR